MLGSRPRRGMGTGNGQDGELDRAIILGGHRSRVAPRFEAEGGELGQESELPRQSAPHHAPHPAIPQSPRDPMRTRRPRGEERRRSHSVPARKSTLADDTGRDEGFRIVRSSRYSMGATITGAVAILATGMRRYASWV